MSSDGGSRPPMPDMARGKDTVQVSGDSSWPAQVPQSEQRFESTCRELVLHSASQAKDQVDEDEDVLEDEVDC
jgi:hypothetical protein